LSRVWYIVLLSAIFALQCSAKDLLYYKDYSIYANDSLDMAIEKLSEEHNVTTASSIIDFEAHIGNNSYDLVILFLQDEPHDADEFSHFISYVESGGKVIFTDANKKESWSRLFDFQYSDQDNYNRALLVNRDLKNSYVDSELVLYNPGYRTYSIGLKPQGRVLASYSGGAAMLWINEQTIINGILSDTMLAEADARAATQTNNIFLAQINFLLSPPSSYIAEVPLLLGNIMPVMMLIAALFYMSNRRRKGV